MLVNILIRVLMALEVIVCLMLIGIILIQKSKGQGLGLSFGGGAAESVFGGQMGNVLTRTTVILAIVFLVNTTVLAILKPQGASADVTAYPVKHIYGNNADHTAGIGYPAARMANSLATPLLRVADVMLILAEAKVILSSPGNPQASSKRRSFQTSSKDTLVNAVRPAL